jgi:hypothetical protein
VNKHVKKLSLNRETIGALHAMALKAVRGGDDSAECITWIKCGFSWWTCDLSGCGNYSCTCTD